MSVFPAAELAAALAALAELADALAELADALAELADALALEAAELAVDPPHAVSAAPATAAPAAVTDSFKKLLREMSIVVFLSLRPPTTFGRSNLGPSRPPSKPPWLRYNQMDYFSLRYIHSPKYCMNATMMTRITQMVYMTSWLKFW